MALLIMEENTTKGFSLDATVADGGFVRFQWDGFEDTVVVNSNKALVVIPAQYAKIINNGKPWTLKHNGAVIDSGTINIEPAEGTVQQVVSAFVVSATPPPNPYEKQVWIDIS
jgi:hypothetical protein